MLVVYSDVSMFTTRVYSPVLFRLPFTIHTPSKCVYVSGQVSVIICSDYMHMCPDTNVCLDTNIKLSLLPGAISPVMRAAASADSSAIVYHYLTPPIPKYGD